MEVENKMSQCPICQSKNITNFLNLKNSPILQNILFLTQEHAKSANKIDVNFEYCSHCHFVFNAEFEDDKVEYSEKYDNSQLASSTYLKYIEDLVSNIIKDCKLKSTSRMLEIGCGNGYFLSMLQKQGNFFNLIGYDPAYNGQFGMSKFIKKAYYDPAANDKFDLIILRHTLEGLLNYRDILESIESSMTEESFLYIETVDLDHIIKSHGISLMYHEYARYYSIRSLSILFNKLNIYSVYHLFNDNYLGVLLKKRPTIEAIGKNINKINRIIRNYGKVVIFGIGGRAISFLTNQSLDESVIQFGVDINKEKQGKYIPVTGQLIISPEEAKAFNPELIIISNLNYLSEIRALMGHEVKYLTLEGELCE